MFAHRSCDWAGHSPIKEAFLVRNRIELVARVIVRPEYRSMTGSVENAWIPSQPPSCRPHCLSGLREHPFDSESITFLENSMTYGESLSDTAAEALPTLGGGELAEGGVNTRPVLGGETSVTLTAASTLASLGVSVSSLGSASIDTSDGDPVARFAITGGTEGPGDGTNIFLHQDSGLKLSSPTGALELRDFRIDTENMVVSANVTVNGAAAGNVAVFDIG